VSGFPKVPVYFRYFSCEGKDGKIKFYDDIYEEDRFLREKYFLNKTVDLICKCANSSRLADLRNLHICKLKYIPHEQASSIILCLHNNV